MTRHHPYGGAFTFYDWKRQEGIESACPHFHVIRRSPGLPEGYRAVSDPFSDVVRSLLNPAAKAAENLLTNERGTEVLEDMKICPPLKDESRRMVSDLLAVYGIDHDREVSAIGMIEDLRRAAFDHGYRNGHYLALEESL